MATKRFRRLVKMINWYPPFWGAGIRVRNFSEDLMKWEVELKLTWWNKNVFGTQFGGSLYAMCDPFFCFIVAEHLGKDFYVWDKAAKIEFVKPGRGKVRAIFEIPPDQLVWIKEQAAIEKKFTFWLDAEVLGEKDEVVALVKKEIYVSRKKGRARSEKSEAASD
ncbi:MAG: DUF4442 domain-containing protein [Saprospiraceae bacterium]|nr:DUF4442 domain-containing protein [Saprospiraceae bacterium]